MTVYPGQIDSDATIFRIDDNLSQIGGEAINQLRDAVFAIEKELGVGPSGSALTVAARLAVSLNQDGTIKASALNAVGLATLPLDDTHVAANAGIKESKLSLTHTTAALHTLISSNTSNIVTINSSVSELLADLALHIAGANLLSDGDPARHVASHIDINATPNDSRDVGYVWTGLKDKDGVSRSATQVAEALLEINDALTDHENLVADAHPATSITVDTNTFTEIPLTADTVQKALNELDAADRLKIGIHRATQHGNGIPETSRSLSVTLPDGYGENIVENTRASAFLIRSPASGPVDDTNDGDDIVKFHPDDNAGFKFDAQFSAVSVGDIVRINYGNGIIGSFPIESKRHVPGTEWVVRINGYNLFGVDGYEGNYASARIDRSLFDDEVAGVLATAPANNNINSSIMSSLIVADPRGAMALGLNFDPNKIDQTHYNLYIQFFPTGNPADKVINLPAIDITGNLGATPGRYSLKEIVLNVNNQFRRAGYNYRMIAFERNGEFGLVMTDSVNGASFSIVNGEISGETLITGSYTNNVIDDVNGVFDALGLGNSRAAYASPAYVGTFSSGLAALLATKVISPRKNKSYVSDGTSKSELASGEFSIGDGYWPATITNRALIASTTYENTYVVNLGLCPAELKPGKTILIQPEISFGDSNYSDQDYGLFFIKSVSVADCPGDNPETTITVINGVHGTGNPISSHSPVDFPVRIYFSESAVSFNNLNIVDPTDSGTDYIRYHEIYATPKAETFSHERIRIPKQSETGTILGTTNNWKIIDVSPKLRGYRDSGSSSLDKHIRFMLLSYNSSTGEFDGYIGQKHPSNNDIINPGPVISSKKNLKTKYYDASGVDYIELEFVDKTTSPGINVMSSSAKRYVDIDVFPSLALNEESMMISGCQLNEGIVDSITDKRQFGSVDPKDLTDNAVDFIQAGDRHLHENGVIRGFDITGVLSSDNRIVNVKGGVALVDGAVVTVNDGSITIPQISKTGIALPQNLVWALCVTKGGQYRAILIINDKVQFFATQGSGNYLIETSSFEELVFKRKDLTVIGIANTTIASITVDARDARRFIVNSGFSFGLITLESGNTLNGSFKTLDSVKSWVNNLSNSSTYTVHIRGSFDVLGQNDLNFDSTKTVMITRAPDGPNATLNFPTNTSYNIGKLEFKNITLAGSSNSISLAAYSTLSGCIVSGFSKLTLGEGNEVIGSNITITPTIDGTSILVNGINCKIEKSTITSLGARKVIDISGNKSGTVIVRNDFNYGFDQSITFDGTSYTNHFMDEDIVGCIVSRGNNFDINISSNRFSQSSSDPGTQRPPFIAFMASGNQFVTNVSIIDNKFTDPGAFIRNAAIVLMSEEDVLPVAKYDTCYVEKNRCNGDQGIYINGYFKDFCGSIYGMVTTNVRVCDNTCGMIGYSIYSDNNSFRSQANSLVIDGNHCKFIGTVFDTGRMTNPPFVSGVQTVKHSGNTTISDNTCSWIRCGIGGVVGNKASLTISENKLHANDLLFIRGLEDVEGQNRFSIYNTANNSDHITDQGIGVYHVSDDTENVNRIACKISENIISRSVINSVTYKYGACIASFVSAKIAGNIIDGIAEPVGSKSGHGIAVLSHPNQWTTKVGNAEGYRDNFLQQRRFTITNNDIRRYEETIGSYIKLPGNDSATSYERFGVGGIIKDNIFDYFSPIDGYNITDSAVIPSTISGYDNILPTGVDSNLIPSVSLNSRWVVENNYNQVRTVRIPFTRSKIIGHYRPLGSTTSAINNIAYSLNYPSDTGEIIVNPQISDDVVYSAQITNETTTFRTTASFIFDLTQILPKGVTIISISMNYACPFWNGNLKVGFFNTLGSIRGFNISLASGGANTGALTIKDLQSEGDAWPNHVSSFSMSDELGQYVRVDFDATTTFSGETARFGFLTIRYKYGAILEFGT